MSTFITVVLSRFALFVICPRVSSLLLILKTALTLLLLRLMLLIVLSLILIMRLRNMPSVTQKLWIISLLILTLLTPFALRRIHPLMLTIWRGFMKLRSKSWKLLSENLLLWLLLLLCCMELPA